MNDLISDNDSFILIDISINAHSSSNINNPIDGNRLITSNAQLAHSITSNKTNQSNDEGWSEISAPSSVKSLRSVPRKDSASSINAFMNMNLKNMIPDAEEYDFISNHNNNNNPIIPMANDRALNPQFTQQSINKMSNVNINSNGNGSSNNNANYANNNSMGSVGSRVPFSWAEITKIQPQFHNDVDDCKEVHKPKVFDSTPRIQAINKVRNSSNQNVKKNTKKNTNIIESSENGTDYLPGIPETDPYAVKGKKCIKKAGKKGSRLKYPNGKRGSKRNSRRKK